MKPTRLAILAALPREIRPLVRDWPVHVRLRQEGAELWETEGVIAVCAGMGRERVKRALEIAESRANLHGIFSVGYAGALRPEISIAAVYRPALVIDAGSGERFEWLEGSAMLVTVDHVVDEKEKRVLAAQWNADLVDMEAAAVAGLACERGLPFRTLRAVSDGLTTRLPDMSRFTNEQGGILESALAWHLAWHPWQIPAALQVSRQTARASCALAEALAKVLRETT